jgi:hypothetical protein
MEFLIALVGVVVGYVLAQASTSLSGRNATVRQDEATFNTLEAWLLRNVQSLEHTLGGLNKELEIIGENKRLVGPMNPPGRDLLPFLMPRLPNEIERDPEWTGALFRVALGAEYVAVAVEHRNLYAISNGAMVNFYSVLKALDEDLVTRVNELLDAVRPESERVSQRRPKHVYLSWLFRG